MYDGSADWVAELQIHTPGSFEISLEANGNVLFQEAFVVEPVRGL